MFMMLGLLGADASDAWPVQAFSAGVKAEVRSSRNGADVDDAWLVGVPCAAGGGADADDVWLVGILA